MERHDGPLTPALAEARFTSQRAWRRRIEDAYAGGGRAIFRGALLGTVALLLDQVGPPEAGPLAILLGLLGAALVIFGGLRMIAAFALSRRAAP